VIRLFRLHPRVADHSFDDFDEMVRGKPPVAPGATPDIWAHRRAPPRDLDRALMSPTHLWLRQIPGALHPKWLCRHYPRVANRLAELWADYQATDQLLNELTTDRRGHREGFPHRVMQELRIVQVVHQWRKYHRGQPPVRTILQVCKGGASRSGPRAEAS